MSMEHRHPSSIGPYRVVDRIGAGGMGTVYRVTHRATGAVAAAKVLHASSSSPVARDRFRNEARIHMALRHPRIATVYEYMEVGDAPCLIMEFVDGETLEERIRRQPLTVQEALRYFASLVDAVGYVHQRGVIHRDLKTNNVKLDERGSLKLLDFGIAMGADTPRFTSTGNVVGTLIALSPEQLRTGRADVRSDIWALGAILYEMLTGRSPFQGSAPGILTERILTGEFEPASQLRPDVPRAVDRIISRCLRTRPSDRYASCEALLTDVDSAASGESPGQKDLWRVPASILENSGEMAQRVARQWQLAASGLAAVAALLFFAWAVGSSSGGDSGRLPDAQPHTPAQPQLEIAPAYRNVDGPATDRVQPALPARPPSRDNEDLSQRQLLLRVVQGDADVYRDGMLVGKTPFRLQARLGEVVTITLRREGCEELPLRLRVEEGVLEFTESFRRCSQP
jgi:hypothetical protein